MEKSIFIGLGGSGVDTLAKIKYKIYKSIKKPQGDNRPPHEIMGDDQRFFFIDTDMRDIISNNKYYASLYANNEVPLISRDEFIDIGAFNPKAIIDNVRRDKTNPKLLEAVNDRVFSIMANEPLRNGAGAFRIQGRTAFDRKNRDFHSLVLNAIVDMKRLAQNNPNLDFNFWVVCSSCGGTGSSILIDVLYMIKKAFEDQFPANDPKVKLVLYMPKFYIDANSKNPNYPLNAYAMFTELDLLMADRFDGNSNSSIMHRLNLLRDTENFQGQFKPFSYCIPVDFYTESDNNFRDKAEMFQNTAEMIYYLYKGDGGQTLISGLVNDISNIFANSTPDCFNYLIPAGYRALKKPEKEFTDYIEKRFVYELINYGLLGSAMSDVYTRERDLKQFVMEQTTKEVFSRVFSTNALIDVPNLENMIDGQVNEISNDYFSHSLFFDARGRLVKEQDANYIKQKYDETINTIETTLKRNFETQWKYDQILNISDRLWELLEEHVMKFGLEFTSGLFYHIDLLCEEKINIIESSLENLNSSNKNIVRVVEEKRQIFFNKPNQNNAQGYFKSKTELLNNRCSVLKLIYQKELLKELCFRGQNRDDGLIDEMEMFINELKSHVNRLRNSTKNTLQNLATSFLALQRDVTTTYIPDISRFIDSGWTSDNAFAMFYHEVMPLNSRTDLESGIGYRPLRNNRADIHSIEKRGLHKLMYEAIHVSGNNAGRHYFNDSTNRIELFKKGKELNYSVVKIIDDFVSIARDYFLNLVNQNQQIQNNWFGMTITQFFNSLDSQHKREIAEKFDSSGIQLFYNYNRNSQVNVDEKFVYVADKEVTARTILGYTGRNNEQCIEDSSLRNTVYKIKVSVSHALSGYNFLKDMKDAYQRSRNDGSLYHHIHDWLNSNSSDLLQIRNLISRDEDSNINEALLKYLFFNELVKILESKKLLDSIFYIPRLASQKAKVAVNPLIIEESGTNIQVNIAKSSYTQENKIYFKKDEMITIYAGANNLLLMSQAISQSEDFHLCLNLITRLLNVPAIKQQIFPNFETISDSIASELDKKWQISTDANEKRFLEKIIDEVTTLEVSRL